jgi:uncharacterized protein YfaS (alpha-2-macroglobulin family)
MEDASEEMLNPGSIKPEDSDIPEEELKTMLTEDTIFYSPLSETAFSDGMVTFRLPNRVGKFRVTLLGVSSSGQYGMHTSFIHVQKPFNAILRFPEYIRDSDQIRLELLLQNNSE